MTRASNGTPEDDGGGHVNGGGVIVVTAEATGALDFTRRAPLPAVKVSEDEIARKLLFKLA